MPDSTQRHGSERLFPILCLGTAATIAALTIAKHATFHSSVYDLGIFHQVLWNTARGDLFATSLKHMRYLGDHFSPSLALLAPLEWSPFPIQTLLVVQALTIAVSAYAMREIARLRGLSPLPAVAIGLATLLHPAFFKPLFFDFHPEPFIAAAIAVGLLQLERGRPRWAAVLFALALGGKEDVALILAPLGFALAWTPQWRRFGAVLTVTSLLWFALCMTVFMPAFRPVAAHPGWFYQARYAHLGSDTAGVVRFILLHPFASVARSMTWPKALTILALLAPFGLATLPGWRFLLAAAPLAAVHLLSAKREQFDTGAQYLLPLVPLLAYAACEGARRTTARWPRGHLFVAVLTAIVLSLLPRLQKWKEFTPGPHHDARRAAVAMIPEGASACANNRLGAHLTGRHSFDLCVAPNMARDQYDHFGWPLAVKAEWLIFDANEVGNDPLSEPRADALVAAGAEVVFHQSGIRVLHASPEVFDRLP